MATAGIMVRVGRKWRAKGGLEVAEPWLKYKALMGTVVTVRAGLSASV